MANILRGGHAPLNITIDPELRDGQCEVRQKENGVMVIAVNSEVAAKSIRQELLANQRRAIDATTENGPYAETPQGVEDQPGPALHLP